MRRPPRSLANARSLSSGGGPRAPQLSPCSTRQFGQCGDLLKQARAPKCGPAKMGLWVSDHPHTTANPKGSHSQSGHDDNANRTLRPSPLQWFHWKQTPRARVWGSLVHTRRRVKGRPTLGRLTPAKSQPANPVQLRLATSTRPQHERAPARRPNLKRARSTRRSPRVACSHAAP